MKGLKMMGQYLLVEREREGYAGEIVVPDRYRGKSSFARVLAVGPKVEAVRPGDRVVVRQTVGVEIVISGAGIGNKALVRVEEKDIEALVDG